MPQRIEICNVPINPKTQLDDNITILNVPQNANTIVRNIQPIQSELQFVYIDFNNNSTLIGYFLLIRNQFPKN